MSASHFRPEDYRHVDYLWRDEEARERSGAELLIYRSNLLGQDLRITNTGGGNTSAKLPEKDPLTSESVEVLWVKGSGGDLRTSTIANFSSLYQEKLIALQPLYEDAADNGPKTPLEDRMVDCYPHCTFALNPRASSIDTPLHSFIPRRHVDHVHPNAIIAVAAARDSEALTRTIFGDDVAWIPWQRPGFDLGLVFRDLYAERPNLQGVVLGMHGLICGAEDSKSSYDLTLSLIERATRFLEERDRGPETFGGAKYQDPSAEKRADLLADLLPWLRGRLSHKQRVLCTHHADSSSLEFVNSLDAARLAELGTSCPDHFLRTKIKPLYVDWDPSSPLDELKDEIDEGLSRYRADYAAYYEECRRPDSPAMRDPNPTVILVPGIGILGWGKNKSESRVTAEFYRCAIEVMRGAEALGGYVALPRQEAFDIEYWALEEAKLRRQPKEAPFSRRMAIVIGAGHGIGEATAHRLAGEGAHVVCADLDREAAEQTANAIIDKRGLGVGLAGTGASDCGPSFAADVDITRRSSVRDLLNETILAYGGIDHVVVTAGLYASPDQEGRNDDRDWSRSFDVNVTGVGIVADEAGRIWRDQELTGSLVVTTSVNAVVPKKGSLPYDVSKAAANHLVRELAVTLAPLVRVNAVAPATVIEGSTMFPRERLIASLAKYGLTWDDSEETEILRERLAAFYAKRTLTQSVVRPIDTAEAIAFLAGDLSSRTTGQILTVDGGLPEAFTR